MNNSSYKKTLNIHEVLSTSHNTVQCPFQKCIAVNYCKSKIQRKLRLDLASKFISRNNETESKI